MAELLPLITTVQNNGYTCSENLHILKTLLGLGKMIMHPSIIVRKRFGSIKKKKKNHIGPIFQALFLFIKHGVCLFIYGSSLLDPNSYIKPAEEESPEILSS